VEEVRDEADAAVKRASRAGTKGAARRGRPARDAGAGSGGADAKQELVRALGAARGARANDRLRDAAHAFERERYEEARKLLKPVAEQAPQALAVRELLGLTYYRLGRWKDAVRELDAFREGSGSTEQHPVLADAYRALGRHRDVEALWEELKDASPAADLVAEGRIVMAGSRADRGDLAGAIDLLRTAGRPTARPAIHHLRQTYVLADLHERAGDVARARELFRYIASHEPDFVDASERAASLG
jgi:tetratricopeptide (TPR) repeat protein